VEPVVLEAAEMIAAGIEKRAPLGPTGNLKKSIKAKLLKRRGKNPAPAIAAIDRKIAPHAHWVEKGTKIRKVGKKKVMYGKKTGQFYGKEVAPMRANRFFQKGRNASQKKALHHVVTKLQAIIEGAAK